MLNTKRIWWIILPVIFILSVSGCATFNPRPVEEIPFRERAQTQDKGNVRVTAAVPSAEESKRLFGVDIYKRGVQPIWLEIENKAEEPLYFLPLGLDPNYFSPIEAAYVNHFGFKTPANEEINRFFYEQQWTDGLPIMPPTVRAVEAMLRFTDRSPDEVLGVLPPGNCAATIWKVAVNGVMAGCRPEPFISSEISPPSSRTRHRILVIRIEFKV